MNIAQATNNNCGQAKLKYSRDYLLSILRNNVKNLHVNRSTRKTIWNFRLWNFSRIKFINRFVKLRQSTQFKWPSILCGNLQSMKNKFDEVNEIIHCNNCDINVFTESWLNDSVNYSISSVVGYNQFRLDRSSKGGGGIIAHIRSSIKVSVIQFSNDENFEILPLLLDKTSHLLICLYHPYWQDINAHENTIDKFFQIISSVQEFSKRKLKISILGDFNGLVQHMNIISDSFCLENVVTFPTRGNRTLDCCFTSKTANYTCVQLAPAGKSDHCIFKCISNKPTSSCNVQTTSIPDFSPLNRLLFHQMMLDLQFEIPDVISDVLSLNLYFDTLLATICSLFDYCFPRRTIKLYNSLPWINNTIRHLIRKRDVAFRRKNYTLFKHYRSKVKSSIAVAKRNYCSTIKTLSSKNSWKRINTVISTNNKLDASLNTISAQMLLDHFTSIKSFENPSMLNFIPECNDEFINLSEDEVLYSISQCSKGGGVPFLPGWIFTNYSLCLVKPLTVIFQASLNLGHLPNNMKIAKITPVPKVKSPESVSDYRPISCTSPFLKILERIVMKRWLSPLITEDHFSDQFAFIPLPGRGCVSALTTIYSRCISLLDNQHEGSLLFIDFSKAFDRASTFAIIDSLIKLGASYLCITWIYNFLQDRQVFVSYNNISSSFTTISGGTPQGSIISPVLFSILLHTLKPTTTSCTFYKYADDLTILHHIQSTSQQSDIHFEINNLMSWCNSNSMVINEKKTQLMILSRKKSKFVPSIKINNINIKSTNSVKLLGLHLTDDLKWGTQVSHSIISASKLFYSIIVLKRTKMDPALLFRIYSLLVRPLLTYSCITTINMPQQLFSKLLKAEKCFLRIIRYTPNFTLKDHINHLVYNFVQSVKKYPEHPFRQLLITNDTSKTRSRRSLISPHFKTTLMQKSVFNHFL